MFLGKNSYRYQCFNKTFLLITRRETTRNRPILFISGKTGGEAVASAIGAVSGGDADTQRVPETAKG